MEVSFTIPMKPTGKGRPRLVGRGAVYTPTKTKAYENFVKGCYIEQCDGYNFGESTIIVDVEAYMPVPTKFRKAEKLAALRGELKPAEKPDVDNILKAILDALNELAYADDRFIYKLSIVREYSENPRTVVKISDNF